MRIVILGLALLLTGAAHLNASSYFVDYVGGSDSNTGTNQNAPWKHCPGDPAATGVAAAFSLLPSDTVFFKGGVTYLFTGSTGIALKWDGAAGAKITYDGNSAGTWGTGRAKFSDNSGANAITAFSSSATRRNLAFKSLEIAQVGGAAALPADGGAPVAARFGGGMAFNGGVDTVSIDDCVFRELGYWYNQKPMNAASISGVGISASTCHAFTITNCDFSRMAVGCEVAQATETSGVEIANTAFRDALLWPVDLPAGSGAAATGSVSVHDCTFLNDNYFSGGNWAGYGYDPRTDVWTADAGSVVSYSAAAIASPAATFQWMKNGIAVPGATGVVFTLSPVTTNDGGTYSVTATNAGGSATSNSAVLVVNGGVTQGTLPVFTLQPVSQIAAVADAITFTSAVTGTPAPTYQWMKDGIAIAGATNVTLTLASVNLTDAGVYTLVARNISGAVTSSAATLTVNAAQPQSGAPVFTLQPANQAAAFLGKVTFSAQASGSPTYQWLKNGVAINGWTGATLTIDGVSSNDEGIFKVVATNASGSVTSNPATLTIGAVITPQSGAPVFTVQPTNQAAAFLGKVTFSASATGSPTYQWLKNGVAVNGWTGATLTLDGVSSNDEAVFKVVATNASGSVTSNPATLTIGSVITPQSVAPAFTLQPVSQTVNAAATVTFSVAASGTPAPTFQWLKNGTPITGANTSVLSLTNVSSADSATYTAVAFNTAGSVTSSAATLSVNAAQPPSGAPVFTVQPTNQAAAFLGKVTFSASASGSPTYQWLKNGVAINGWTGATLTLDGVSSNDEAVFKVVATNSFGSVTSNPATLTVNAAQPPSGAPVFTVQPISQTASFLGKVTFSATASGSPTYQWLRNGVVINGWTGATLTLDGVSSNDNGTYAVVASNASGSTTSAPATLMVGDPGATTANGVTTSATSAPLVFQTANVTSAAPAASVSFTVTGSAPKKLFIRAAGPSFAAVGGTGTMTDPVIALYLGGVKVIENDNWGGAAALSAAAAQAGAVPFVNAGSKDAALLVTLPPGSYDLVISGAAGSTGAALLEVYELP